MKHLIFLVLLCSTHALYAGTAGIADGEKLLSITIVLIVLILLVEKFFHWLKAYRMSKKEPDVIDGEEERQ